MPNPFEARDKQFLVLRNHENQHSMWPSHIKVPAGWTVAFGEASHAACLEYVEKHWGDMRPKSLIEAEAADAK